MPSAKLPNTVLISFRDICRKPFHKISERTVAILATSRVFHEKKKWSSIHCFSPQLILGPNTSKTKFRNIVFEVFGLMVNYSLGYHLAECCHVPLGQVPFRENIHLVHFTTVTCPSGAIHLPKCMDLSTYPSNIPD